MINSFFADRLQVTLLLNLELNILLCLLLCLYAWKRLGEIFYTQTTFGTVRAINVSAYKNLERAHFFATWLCL